MPLVYRELHLMAARQLSREWRVSMLQTTALVSEAYLKLVGQREVDWQNRAHFFAIAAQVMRRVIVDHARRDGRVKHGAGLRPATLDDAEAQPARVDVDAVDALAVVEIAFDELENVGHRFRRFVGIRLDRKRSLDRLDHDHWCRRHLRVDQRGEADRPAHRAQDAEHAEHLLPSGFRGVCAVQPRHPAVRSELSAVSALWSRAHDLDVRVTPTRAQ